MSVILDGKNFGYIFASSGTRGFFGEGYQHHAQIKKFCSEFGFDGSTFVSKTATVSARMNPEKGEGNLLLDPQTLMPAKFFNDCIRMNLFTKETFNAVALSNPGLKTLIETGRWQRFGGPMFISVMVLGDTEEECLPQYEEIGRILKQYLPDFLNPVALEVNITCPNAGCDLTKAESISRKGLAIIASYVDIPVGVKVTILTSTSFVESLYRENLISFVSVTNTIPWARLDELGIIKGKSPLAKYGGGAYTGPKLLPFVAIWVSEMRALDENIQIIGGGGITKPEDLFVLKPTGLNAAAFASMSMTRPQNVQSTIKLAKKLFGG